MRAVLCGCAVLLGFSICVAAPDEISLAKAETQLGSKDKKVRLKTVQLLADGGEAASTLLCNAMLDKEITVAKAALASLEKANPKLYEPLNRMVNYDDTANQLRSLKALAELGEKSQPAFSLLEARMRSTAVNTTLAAPDREDFVKRYLVILEKSGKERDVVDLHKSLAEKPIPYTKRKESMDWLVKWAGDNQKRQRELMFLIKANVTSGTPSVEYIQLAGKYGELSKDLVPALKKLDFSPSEGVRQAALEAIKQIEK